MQIFNSFTADPSDYTIITTTDSGSVVIVIVASVIALVVAIAVSTFTVLLVICLCHHSKSIHYINTENIYNVAYYYRQLCWTLYITKVSKVIVESI